MTDLSEHFTLAELTVSQTALRKGIDNTPPPPVIAALTALCGNVLEPIRKHFGPVVVSSGYRSPALNKAIGGSASSDHCHGRAADFTVPGALDIDVAQWVMRHLRYDQLILEFPPQGWVHVSWRPANNRMQELTAKRINGRVSYLAGLRP